jgi:hypothetical protein
MATDYAEALLAWLQTHDDAASIRTKIVGEADGIVEAGELTASLLTAAEETRRTSPAEQVLALSIQDAGEEPNPRHLNQLYQFVVVRILDRRRGYSNVRLVRKAVKAVLDQMPRTVTDVGVGIPRYRGRSGHRWDSVFNVTFEAITLRVDITTL